MKTRALSQKGVNHYEYYGIPYRHDVRNRHHHRKHSGNIVYLYSETEDVEKVFAMSFL